MRHSSSTCLIGVACSLLALAAPSDAWISTTQLNSAEDRFFNAFPLDSVQLEPDSPAGRAQALNAEYLRMIDPDSLLWTFRQNSGLPHAKGLPYYGSWEDPAVEVRGQFTGHILSATALHINSTGDEVMRNSSAYLVKELKKVQDAIGTGYLSAFPESHFDRLQCLQPVWAPFYVIHKIMAGLLDQYMLAGDDLALTVVLGMADWAIARVDAVVNVNGTARWHETLETEFGGMQEVLTNLYTLTGHDAYLRTADLFVKHTFFDPLAEGQDVLEGRHANTHLAQVNGFAARYESTGDTKSLAATSAFWTQLTSRHSYASGGSNDNEFWGAPMKLGDTFQEDKGINTQESCTTYNVLKLTRSLFRWTSNSNFCNFYERALTNGVLGIARMPALQMGRQTVRMPETEQHSRALLIDPRLSTLHSRYRHRSGRLSRVDSDAPGPGVYLYHMPMGRSGVAKADNFHGWGHRFSSFWCCYGTAVESLAKLGDSIFFWRHPRDELPTLYINQLQPSTLRWDALGLNITLRSSTFSDDGFATMTLLFSVGTTAESFSSGAKSVTINLKVRVPDWTEASGMLVSLDGKPMMCSFTADDAKGYCSIVRSFRTGQRLDVKLPMQPRVETLQDDRPVFQAFKSLFIGPHLYAGLTHGPRIITADPAKVATMVEPLTTEGHLSLAPSWAPSDTFLRHDNGSLYISQVEDSGDALDATFRLVPGLSAAVNGSDHRPIQLHVLQQWLRHSSTPPPVEIVSLEVVGSPGSFIGIQPVTNWLDHVLQVLQAQAIVSPSPTHDDKTRQQHTFWLRRGLLQRGYGFSLESVFSPGKFLVSGIPVGGRRCDSEDECASGTPLCTASCARWDSRYNRLQIRKPPAAGSEPAMTFAESATFHATTAQGRMPEGSKVLRTEEQSYIISPLSSIVDERYTAYFEWIDPSKIDPNETGPQTFWSELWDVLKIFILVLITLMVVGMCVGAIVESCVERSKAGSTAAQAAAAAPPAAAATSSSVQPLGHGHAFQLEGIIWTALWEKPGAKLFYYNNQTRASQWEDPRIAASAGSQCGKCDAPTNAEHTLTTLNEPAVQQAADTADETELQGAGDADHTEAQVEDSEDGGRQVGEQLPHTPGLGDRIAQVNDVIDSGAAQSPQTDMSDDKAADVNAQQANTELVPEQEAASSASTVVPGSQLSSSSTASATDKGVQPAGCQASDDVALGSAVQEHKPSAAGEMAPQMLMSSDEDDDGYSMVKRTI